MSTNLADTFDILKTITPSTFNAFVNDLLTKVQKPIYITFVTEPVKIVPWALRVDDILSKSDYLEFIAMRPMRITKVALALCIKGEMRIVGECTVNYYVAEGDSLTITELFYGIDIQTGKRINHTPSTKYIYPTTESINLLG